MSNLRHAHVAQSILGVKGHIYVRYVVSIEMWGNKYMDTQFNEIMGPLTLKIDTATRPFLGLNDMRHSNFLKSTGRHETFLKSTGRHEVFLNSTGGHYHFL